jgi:DNA-binding NarL/FixJ family response regulator
MAKVLIVENELLIALRIQSTLSEAGHEIVGVAANSKDALALAAEKMPEIAIVNISLDHGESGIEVAKLLSQQASRPQIVFHTAAADPQTLAAARATRPAAFLAKHASGSELVALVSALARR